jgi:hypothetical protein
MASIFNILTLIIALVTAALYWIGLENYFFWYYPWYDIPIHILGGLTAGLWGCALAARRGFKPWQALVFCLLIAVAVGCVWEIFEYVTGISRELGYWFDTTKDMVDDILGATLAVGLYRATYRRKP